MQESEINTLDKYTQFTMPYPNRIEPDLELSQFPIFTDIEKTNPNKAVSYYEKAIKMKSGGAMCHLGYCYENGLGVEKNMQKAQEWYAKAEATGYKM